MERRIEDATKLKEVPKEAVLKHNGFSQWDSYSSRRDHDTILQVNFFLKHIQFNLVHIFLSLLHIPLFLFRV